MAYLKEHPGQETDRERLIEELIELKALTTGFFESVPGSFIVLDSQWRLVYLKGDIIKILADGEESLKGRPLEEIAPKSLRHILTPMIIEPLLEGKETESVKYSSQLHKWFKISAYESDSGIFIRLEDVTREQMVNRLLRLNEFSVNRARDMVFWVKTGGHIIFSNMAAGEALKYSPEELGRMKMPQIDPAFSGHKWTEFVAEIKGVGSTVYESSLRARDGSAIPVEVTANYLKFGEDEYIMAFIRDITARKTTEKSLRDAKAEAELYVDLMGHDINNMNQVALGFLELALDQIRTEGKIDGAQIDLVAKPYEMLQNSSQLIENVRKAQRERAGQYETRVMDMGKVLQDVKKSYANVAGRDIRIEFTRDGECQVAANELLKDIFLNLVGNAIKHSSGPILINIDMATISDHGRVYCRVVVEDNGPGISNEMKNKLLDRLSPEYARTRGKGFGLYLIKQLVDDFHGKFWMEDRVRGDHTQGARFVVMLPALEN